MLNFLNCGNWIWSFCTKPNTSTNSMALDKPSGKVWSFSKNPMNPLNGPWVISIISPGLNSSCKGSSLVQRCFKQVTIVSDISIGSVEVPNLKSWETPLVDLIGNQLLVTSDKRMNKYLGHKGSVASWILPCCFFELGRLARRLQSPELEDFLKLWTLLWPWYESHAIS